MDLIALDETVFRWINMEGHNPLFDYLLPFIRNKLFWAPLYIFAIAFLLINFPKKGWLLILSLAICITVSDTMSSKVLKKTIKRDRPCRQFKEDVKLLVHCGGGYSFPSSHATNHFAAAFFFIFTLGRRFKGIKFPLILWALLISYAQVYVGVHFPLDVIAGAILGLLIGKFVAWLYNQFSNQWHLNILP